VLVNFWADTSVASHDRARRPWSNRYIFTFCRRNKVVIDRFVAAAAKIADDRNQTGGTLTGHQPKGERRGRRGTETSRGGQHLHFIAAAVTRGSAQRQAQALCYLCPILARGSAVRFFAPLNGRLLRQSAIWSAEARMPRLRFQGENWPRRTVHVRLDFLTCYPRRMNAAQAQISR